MANQKGANPVARDYDGDEMEKSDTGVEYECDHNGRDCMYGAATKANAALSADMANYQDKSAESQKNVAPSPSDPSLSNNRRGYPSTPGRSSNFGENIRS